MQPAVPIGIGGESRRNRRISQGSQGCRRHRPALILVEGYASQVTGRQTTYRIRVQLAGSPEHKVGDKEERETGGDGRSRNYTRATSVTNQPAEQHRNQRRRINVPKAGVEAQHDVTPNKRQWSRQNTRTSLPSMTSRKQSDGHHRSEIPRMRNQP